MAQSNGTPPYHLLTRWLRDNKIFAKTRSIKNFILDGVREIEGKDEKTESDESNGSEGENSGDIRFNESFRRFCIKISESDCSSFAYDDNVIQAESAHFEAMVFEKVQCILKEHGIVRELKGEEQQKKEASKRRRLLTPDILLDEAVKINDKLIHWIEIKNFFFSSRDGFFLRGVKKAIRKYTRRFGKGAIVCRGWQRGFEQTLGCFLLNGSAIAPLSL